MLRAVDMRVEYLGLNISSAMFLLYLEILLNINGDDNKK